MEAVDRRLCSRFLLSLLLLLSVPQSSSVGVGINYGQIADNLPSPARVAGLLRSLNINRVKLYDADQNVLSAFQNTNVEFIIGIGNENVENMMDSAKAQAWLQQYVEPHAANGRISCITVGNEILSGDDTVLMSGLLPAMQSVYQALVSLGLDKQIYVTTAHSLQILANSFPPSSGSFREDLAEYIQPLINFHAMTKSPFLINAYPFFAYKDDPNSISLPYAVFEPNPGVVDPNTNLNYDNMLYAQIDSVYSAIRVVGHTDVVVRVSETGWPSRGDSSEIGATPENAAAYNGNLLRRIAMNQGTPLMPSIPIDVHVFALFNENLKPGPTSERNYGLYYPNGAPVYNIGLKGSLPGKSGSLAAASNQLMVTGLISFPVIISLLAALLLYSDITSWFPDT
ncbi:Glucan endo-1,3-beta-glucosidase 14 [Platanthera zijinensis]|uniref:glucan endo-1,3-beta-D-glucosidase n=1 Tax=Platanthera zijinensis TaxID=2320716 RepID=A0AAP0C3A1_9ASPA